jgi:hypothetical protein
MLPDGVELPVNPDIVMEESMAPAVARGVLVEIVTEISFFRKFGYGEDCPILATENFLLSTKNGDLFPGALRINVLLIRVIAWFEARLRTVINTFGASWGRDGLTREKEHVRAENWGTCVVIISRRVPVAAVHLPLLIVPSGLLNTSTHPAMIKDAESGVPLPVNPWMTNSRPGERRRFGCRVTVIELIIDGPSEFCPILATCRPGSMTRRGRERLEEDEVLIGIPAIITDAAPLTETLILGVSWETLGFVRSKLKM